MPNAHGGREILGSGIGTVERDINEKTFEPRLKLSVFFGLECLQDTTAIVGREQAEQDLITEAKRVIEQLIIDMNRA
jgi:hypothetical protein